MKKYCIFIFNIIFAASIGNHLSASETNERTIIALDKNATSNVCNNTFKPSTNIETLSRSYSALSNKEDKLIFCINIINHHVIQELKNISDIKIIFGKDFEDYGIEGKVGKARVSFAEFHPSYYKYGTGIMVGWYLAIFYDLNGRIHKYFLSNIWKNEDMWGF